MNREEAYNSIDAIIAKYEIDEEPVTITSTLDYDALRIARKALEQEPCKNAIGREDMLDAIGHGTTYTSEELQRIIKGLPPVNPQPKTGHWIIKDSKEQGYDIGGVKTWYIQIKCSECGFIKTAIEGHTGQYHYCPQCGAKMQEVEE